MNYEKFLRNKLIKKQRPDFKQISHQLQRALKDLETAEANLEIDLTWSYTIAYHSMIRGSRALMFSKGYLPTAKNSHKTIVEFTKLILVSHHKDAKYAKVFKSSVDFLCASCFVF